MVSRVLKKNQPAGPRFFSLAALVVTILPLWALWVYAYATFKSLQNEMETVAQFYGMYLYKEQVQSGLEKAVLQMTRQEEQGKEEREWGSGDGVAEEEWDRLRVLLGPDETPILMEREDLRILYPPQAPYGTDLFLDSPEGTETFLRTIRSMEEGGLRRGHFSIAAPEAPGGSKRQSWFLTVASVDPDRLCVLAVPEERVRLSGGALGAALEGAQKDLLEERRGHFVRLTVPVVVLSSLFIVILYRQSRQPARGRET